MKKVLSISIIVFILCSWFTFTASAYEDDNNYSASVLYFKAEKLFDKHFYKKAQGVALELIKTYPDSEYKVMAESLIGEAMIFLGEYYEGITYLEKLLKENETLRNRIQLYESLVYGYNYYYSWEYQKTIKYVEKIFELLDDKDKLRLTFRDILNYYIRAIRYYDNYNEYPEMDYYERYGMREKKVLDAYDKVYELVDDEEDKAWILNEKAAYYLSIYYYKELVEKKLDLAIEIYQSVIDKYPGTMAAARAQYQIGYVYQQYKTDYVKAIEEYQKVIADFPDTDWANSAGSNIDYIKSPVLNLNVQSVQKSGENTKIFWSIRNVDEIYFSAYKVDLFDITKNITYEGLDKVNLRESDIVKKWIQKTADKGEHKWYYSNNDATGDLTPFKFPITDSGAYLVTGAGKSAEGQWIESRIVIIVSDIAVVSKVGKEEGLFYIVDSESGQPVEKGELLVYELKNWEYVDEKYVPIYKTHKSNFKKDVNGVQTFKFTPNDDYYWSRNLFVVAKYGDNYAVTDNYFYYYWYGYNNNYKIYGYTDRPVYRPGHTVHFKEVIKKYKKGIFTTASNEKVNVRINDPMGNEVYKKELRSNEFGSVSDSFILDEEAKLGTYYIYIDVNGESYYYYYTSGNYFQVEEYKKPEFKLDIGTAKPNYKIGDSIEIKVNSKYYFGSPVVDGKITYSVTKSIYYHSYHPWYPYYWFYDESDYYYGRGDYYYYYNYYYRNDLVSQGEGKTDAEGNFYIKVKSEEFEDQPNADIKYNVTVNLVDESRRQINGSKSVIVTHQAFYTYIYPERYVNHMDEKIVLNVTSLNPNNKPVPFEGTATLSKVTYDEDGTQHTEELKEMEIEVGDTGKKIIELKADTEGYMQYKITTKDDWGNEITGFAYFYVYKDKAEFDHYNYKDIELIADKNTYYPGEELKLLLNTKYEDSYVLVTAEAEDIYFYKVYHISGKSKMIEMEIPENFAPNVTLTANLIKNNQIYRDSKPLIIPPVNKYINLKIIADKSTYKPGEKATFKIQSLDYQNNPVKTEFSIGFVDSSIFYIMPEIAEDIRKFYYGDKRQHNITTKSSYDYSFYGSGVYTKDKASTGMDYAMNGGSGKTERSMTLDSVEESEASYAEDSMDSPTVANEKKESGNYKNDDSGAEKLVEPKVRSYFPDTFYWGPSVQTDNNGEAIVDVTFPDSLTTWRVSAVGISKDSQVGVQKIDLITRKNLIVRMQAPRFFREKDIVYITANVHNYLDSDKEVTVKLNVSNDTLGISHIAESADEDFTLVSNLKHKLEKKVTVGQNGEAKVDFVLKVNKSGKVKITLYGLTNEESDAMELEFPVLEYGSPKRVIKSDFLTASTEEKDQSLKIEIPEEIKEGSAKMTFSYSPSTASVMVKSLPYLIAYPYGCTEQTMSRFLPTVITKKTLLKLGMSLEDVKSITARDNNNPGEPVFSSKEMEKMIKEGLKRLYDFQQTDGGWGWWQYGSSNPYMTSYVLYGLITAKNSKVEVDRNVIDKGIEFLKRRIKSGMKLTRNYWYDDDDNVRMYMMYVISLYDKNVILNDEILNGYLEEMFERKYKMTDYSNIMLALTLFYCGSQENAEIMVKEYLPQFVKYGNREQSAYFGERYRYWYYYDDSIEVTSLALQAYLRIDPENELVNKFAMWLINNRDGVHWYSTKNSAFAIYALADFMEYTKELDPDMNIKITLPDGSTKSFDVNRNNVFTSDSVIDVPVEGFAGKEANIKVSITGQGRLYFTSVLDYFSREDKIEAEGNIVTVDRKYYKLNERVEKKIRKYWENGKEKTAEYEEKVFDREPLNYGDILKSGDLVEVELNIDMANNASYMMFEDPKPAGCEPTELRSGYAWGSFWSNVELRDEKVAFFATYISAGKHKLNYRLRCEIPGRFNVMPTIAEAMYAPLIHGISDSDKLGINDNIEE